MKINRVGFLFIILSSLLLTIYSCSKSDSKEETLEMGYEYFPIDSGIVKIFLVDSISYNDNTQKIDTFQFLLKEEFLGFTDGQGLESHKIIRRSVLFPNKQNWESRISFFFLKTTNNLQMVEDNQRQVKMIFPIGNIQTWNGNSLNNLGRRNFQWQNLYATKLVADSINLPTVSVLEANVNNLIEEIFIRSTYAKNIGLVEFTNNNLNIQSSGTSGYKVSQKLISFSKP
ncbi:MAG: hypothetical protein MH472_13720 [Bacteroidia bacterium]|nr:hypothetical protein [Bacteroidia bacterium]